MINSKKHYLKKIKNIVKKTFKLSVSKENISDEKKVELKKLFAYSFHLIDRLKQKNFLKENNAKHLKKKISKTFNLILSTPAN